MHKRSILGEEWTWIPITAVLSRLLFFIEIPRVSIDTVEFTHGKNWHGSHGTDYPHWKRANPCPKTMAKGCARFSATVQKTAQNSAVLPRVAVGDQIANFLLGRPCCVHIPLNFCCNFSFCSACFCPHFERGLTPFQMGRIHVSATWHRIRCDCVSQEWHAQNYCEINVR